MPSAASDMTKEGDGLRVVLREAKE
jgi:hypothetical protein